MKVSIQLSPAKIAWILVVAGVLLWAASMIGDLLGHYYNTDFIWPLSRQFDFNEEGNYANWYQSFTLLLCSILLAIAGFVARKSGGRFHRHWMGLALVFLFVSLDEAAQIHEATVMPLVGQMREYLQSKKKEASKLAQTNSPPTATAVIGSTSSEMRGTNATSPAQEGDEPIKVSKASWMPYYLAVMVVLVLVYLRFFFALSPRVRTFFVLAAVLYIGGAVIVELLSLWIGERVGDEKTIYQTITNLSELMEMLGVAAFVYALLTHLGLQTEEVAFRCGPQKTASAGGVEEVRSSSTLHS